MILDRHIVVDTVGKKDAKDMNARSVFVGNLSFDMDEEELRKFFEEGMKTMRSTTSKENKEEMVERVRIIREKDTRKGKGFGYVILKVGDDAVRDRVVSHLCAAGSCVKRKEDWR